MGEGEEKRGFISAASQFAPNSINLERNNLNVWGPGKGGGGKGEEEVGPGTGWFSGPKETDRTGSSSWEEVLVRRKCMKI